MATFFAILVCKEKVHVVYLFMLACCALARSRLELFRSPTDFFRNFPLLNKTDVSHYNALTEGKTTSLEKTYKFNGSVWRFWLFSRNHTRVLATIQPCVT